MFIGRCMTMSLRCGSDRCGPDVADLKAAPTRIVIAVGVESEGLMTGRNSVATAEALGQEVAVFPSHHGGFVGGDSTWAGQPEAFAARLHELLDD